MESKKCPKCGHATVERMLLTSRYQYCDNCERSGSGAPASASFKSGLLNLPAGRHIGDWQQYTPTAYGVPAGMINLATLRVSGRSSQSKYPVPDVRDCTGCLQRNKVKCDCWDVLLRSRSDLYYRIVAVGRHGDSVSLKLQTGDHVTVSLYQFTSPNAGIYKIKENGVYS